MLDPDTYAEIHEKRDGDPDHPQPLQKAKGARVFALDELVEIGGKKGKAEDKDEEDVRNSLNSVHHRRILNTSPEW